MKTIQLLGALFVALLGANPASAVEAFLNLPVAGGKVTCGFGCYDKPFYHSAIDYAAASGRTEIYAAAGGRVMVATEDVAKSWRFPNCPRGSLDAYGVRVEIRHDNGYTTRYAHMLPGSLTVKAGDTVGQGQKIGVGDSTGCVAGSHLHFEVKNPGGKLVDPYAKDAYLWLTNPPTLVPFSDDWDSDGYTVAQGDCNDLDPTVSPHALELCNGVDDNCWKGVDEPWSTLLGKSTVCEIGGERYPGKWVCGPDQLRVVCEASGACIPTTCQEKGVVCGSIRTCVTTVLCDACPQGSVCNHSTKQCCTPNCTNKQCGDDGCGGLCGECQPSTNACEASVCTDGVCGYEPIQDKDADGDGYVSVTCGGGDCDDGDPAVHPGALESSDGGWYIPANLPDEWIAIPTRPWHQGYYEELRLRGIFLGNQGQPILITKKGDYGGLLEWDTASRSWREFIGCWLDSYDPALLDFPPVWQNFYQDQSGTLHMVTATANADIMFKPYYILSHGACENGYWRFEEMADYLESRGNVVLHEKPDGAPIAFMVLHELGGALEPRIWTPKTGLRYLHLTCRDIPGVVDCADPSVTHKLWLPQVGFAMGRDGKVCAAFSAGDWRDTDLLAWRQEIVTLSPAGSSSVEHYSDESYRSVAATTCDNNPLVLTEDAATTTPRSSTIWVHGKGAQPAPWGQVYTAPSAQNHRFLPGPGTGSVALHTGQDGIPVVIRLVDGVVSVIPVPPEAYASKQLYLDLIVQTNRVCVIAMSDNAFLRVYCRRFGDGKDSDCDGSDER